MLKGFWKSMPNTSLWYKVKSLCWELIYTWQRAWKGYDDSTEVVTDELTEFIVKMIDILTSFKINNSRLFNDIDENGMSVILDKNHTDAIIQSIIDNFKKSDGDELITEKYGTIGYIPLINFSKHIMRRLLIVIRQYLC